MVQQDIPKTDVNVDLEGSVLVELSRRGYSAEGIELSRSGVEVARERGCTVRLVETSDSGYPNSSFDVAILTHVVEHLENPRETLIEARRIARWVAVEVPLEYHWRTPRDFAQNAIGHINLYNMKLIRQLMQSSGFTVVAERLSNQSRAVHTFHGRRVLGSAKWALREGSLRVVPPLAQRIFTYHGTLLCMSTQ